MGRLGKVIHSAYEEDGDIGKLWHLVTRTLTLGVIVVSVMSATLGIWTYYYVLAQTIEASKLIEVTWKEVVAGVAFILFLAIVSSGILVIVFQKFLRRAISLQVELQQATSSLQKELENKKALLGEIHHRVKNNLQIISSILRLQARQSNREEVSEVLQESQNQIQSIALVHEELYKSETFSEVSMSGYIQRLVKHLATAYHAESIAMSVQADGVMMALNQAIPCGLIVNELVTNALRHAFAALSNEETKTIDITLKRNEKDRHTILTVSDNGSELPNLCNFKDLPSSLGLRIVSTLCRQLKATIDTISDSKTKGTRITIIIPNSDVFIPSAL